MSRKGQNLLSLGSAESSRVRAVMLLLFIFWGQLSSACELCRKYYFDAMESAPKASQLHPEARVVEYTLTIEEQTQDLAGKPVEVLTVNGGTPGPVLHFREGEVARIKVVNRLRQETTSMHWHGVLVPNLEDGVPLVTTPVIEAGKSRTFEFLITQHGTYWYHSHTEHQEQRGVYGAIVIQSRESQSEMREEVLVLGDWTNESPREVQRTLLRGSDWYAYRKGTKQSLWGAYQAGKLSEYWDRQKSLVPTMDLSDIAYDAFLVNGKREWLMVGRPGETVRVRLVNAGASTYFYLDQALGPLKIVAADGREIVPVDIKRLLIAPAETYDFLVKIPDTGQWELRATAQDGSGSVSAWMGQGARHEAVPPPRPKLYGMSEYLTSILDQLDSDTNRREFAAPLSPYAKLRSAVSHPLPQSHREITLKLSGDMMRYEWSFDGLDPSEAEAIKVKEGEAVRIRLVNNTMMHHPIHFHGHFFWLVDSEDPHPETAPLKHTVDVPPMSVRTIEFVANEGRGDWLLHCHLLYHHTSGMARTVRVTGPNGEAPPHPATTHAMSRDYVWGEVAVTTAMATGMVTYQSGRDNWNFKTMQGMHTGDGYEREMSYQRYYDKRLSFIGGYRFDTMMGGTDGFFGGIQYHLPYFVDAELTQQSGGETRGVLFKNLPLTDRISTNLMLKYGTNTWFSSSVNVDYLLTKECSITAGYSSEFGAGVGILYRF